MVKYYVENGHTLGYVHSDYPNVFGVLAANKDGRNWISGPTIFDPSFFNYKEADQSDFDKFRVNSLGHIK